MTTDYDRTDEALPGLEPPRPAAGPLELAARRTLSALEAEGLLEERHALTCALTLELAAAVEAGRASRRASAAAMAAAQLLACMDRLPAPTTGEEDRDAWNELVEEFRQAGRGPAIRDATDS